MDPSLLNPLIHIGYHKTGTTWLQKNLFDPKCNGFSPLVSNQVSKYDKGLFQCQRFARNFIFGEDGNLLASNEFSSETVRGLLADCKPIDSGIPVISHEGLSGSPQMGGSDKQNICRRLSEVFEDPKILIVIRDQKSLILSKYYQYLRGQGTRSLKSYLQQPCNALEPAFDKRIFKFHDLILMYMDTFGKDNVLVLTYEMFKCEPGQFIRCLCEFSGTDLPNHLPFEQKVNSHSGKWLDTKLRFTNYFFRKAFLNGYLLLYPWKPFFKLNLSVKKRLKRLIPEPLEKRFCEEQIRFIEDFIGDYYHDSNRKIEKLTGLDLSKIQSQLKSHWD